MAQGGESFWIATTPETDYPALAGDVAVDVAVVGAGITGVTAAVLLKRAGKTVALLDAERIVRGTTGYTTAKLTSGHGAVYAQLVDGFGEQGARTYAESNQAAIEQVFELATGIACDLERTANYVVGVTAREREKLEREAEVMTKLGLPASFVTETPLPFEVSGAVRLDHQAQFHPRKYLLGLAATIPGDGSRVFENTRATQVTQGEPCVVETDRGNVRAADVVLATQLPFMDRGLFFAKAHPHRSYAVAAPNDPDQAPDGMFINAGLPTRSVRTIRDGERLLLQVGGQGHKPGLAGDEPERYDVLEAFLREHWPEAGEVEYRWSTQDYMSVDRVPFVGRLSRRSKHVYVGTGYSMPAVYKDERGGVHVLSPVCRHLWCYVEWNEAERSWDCPCHGSRYSGEGRVIQGPTVQDLRRIEDSRQP